jgi:endoglucanase
MTDFCQQNHFINNNSDVLIGFVGWAAGSFSPSYTLSLTPTESNGKWTDNQLFTQCIMNEFDMNANATVSPPTSTSSSSSSSSASSTSGSSTKTTGSADPSDTSSAKASETSDSVAAGSYSVSSLQYGLAMAAAVQIWQHLA